ASEDNKVKLLYPGGEYEMNLVESTEGDNGFDISKLRNETGLVTFDPGYTATGSTESKITFINGDEGILRIAAKPADANHNFGHGKSEYVSLLAEGAMI